MLGFHPVASTLGKNKLVEWFQEGEIRAFKEGRERRAEKHDPFLAGKEKDVSLPSLSSWRVPNRTKS
jgi:hypothetical protein